MSGTAVLFDLDGTLIATKALYLEAYRVAVEPYVREDLSREDIMALRPTSELAFLRAVVAEADLDACVEDFYGAYQRLHPDMFEGVYPGIPGLLDRIRSSGLPLGLVTGKSRRAWDITRAAITLGEFDMLVFDDDVRAPKPDPHGLHLAVERMGADPASSFYVGDTMTDIRAAQAAGVRPVTALWAREQDERADFAERARQAGAVVIDHPADLVAILRLDVRTPRRA